MENTDIISLAQQLGAKNLLKNQFSANPLTQRYLTQRGRAQTAQEQLQATTTPLGALSSGIALYMQRKQEDKALEELNAQMQAEQEAKAARRESLINALPEANRVIGGALTNDEDLAKYAMQTLTPPSEEDKLALENKRLQNRKLQKEINQVGVSAGNGEKAPTGYRFTENGALKPIPGGPADKTSSEAAKTLTLATEGIDVTNQIRNQFYTTDPKTKTTTFNKPKFGRASAGAVLPNILASEDAQAFETRRQNLSDLVGRMRSGGAINKDEEARFLKLIPRFGDKEAIVNSKLNQLENNFSSVAKSIDPNLSSQSNNLGSAPQNDKKQALKNKYGLN